MTIQSAPELRTFNGHPILFDCPGYTIWQAPEWRKFTHGDMIAIPFKSHRGDTLYDFFKLGHVWGYYSAIGSEDVEAGVARAREAGHELYWASKQGTIISDPPQRKTSAPGFNFGDVIPFQGKRFRLTSTSNGNCGLVEVIDVPDAPVADPLDETLAFARRVHFAEAMPAITEFLSTMARMETASEFDDRTDGEGMSGDDAVETVSNLIENARGLMAKIEGAVA